MLLKIEPGLPISSPELIAISRFHFVHLKNAGRYGFMIFFKISGRKFEHVKFSSCYLLYYLLITLLYTRNVGICGFMPFRKVLVLDKDKVCLVWFLCLMAYQYSCVILSQSHLFKGTAMVLFKQ